MVETIVPHHTLVSTGYAEMPMDGRRYRFKVERYRHDDGTEWGRIVEKEEIPDVGMYLWIPSYGVTEPAEAQYLAEEWEHEKTHPDPDRHQWLAYHREQVRRERERYDEARDERARLIKKNHRTKGLP